ncbi:hypothetical protein FMEXI_4223 [Fusarium mexicanum]|uniref:Zn(2)-C6 fungal-type domain-containing protein n=1 Tax=Fusarium mexicanum TaxID=751941 RepID=A0A8H5J772_9HYPO|nr:hypothetical protein FMEXI_4223 [Fusarium mexicanum]
MDSEIDKSNSSRSMQIVCSADCELADNSIRQPEETGLLTEKVLSRKHNRMLLSSADQFTSRERQQHKPYVGKERRRVDSSTRRLRLADKSSACRRIMLKAAQRKVRELQMALETSLNENLRLVEELSWWRLSNDGSIPPRTDSKLQRSRPRYSKHPGLSTGQSSPHWLQGTSRPANAGRILGFCFSFSTVFPEYFGKFMPISNHVGASKPGIFSWRICFILACLKNSIVPKSASIHHLASNFFLSFLPEIGVVSSPLNCGLSEDTMLLYTRVSSPKAPKKRSRMGMSIFRSETMFILTALSSSMQKLANLDIFLFPYRMFSMRKKCDEIRPTCRRCQERGQECIYEPVPPRPKPDRHSIHAESSICTDLMSSQDRATQASADYAPTLGSDQDTQGKLADKDQLEEPLIRMQEPALCHLQVNQFVTEPTLSLSGFNATKSSLVSLIDSAGFGLAALDGSEHIVQTIEGNEVQNMVNQELVGISATACDSKQAGAREIYHPSLGLAAPGSTPSFGFNHNPTMFCKLSSRTNRRVLLHHFYDVVSHLTVFHEDYGNPFQQLILALCQESQAVTYAVYALASAHLEYRGVSGHERSTYFHNQAIQGLSRLIQTGGGIHSNELLAAIMLLIYYEVLVHKNCSNVVISHLKGAMTIINNGKAIDDLTGAFLDRAFLFYDVITALSFGTAPLSSAPKISNHQPLSHLNSDDETSSRDTIDNVLGMATSLWPIIHRLSSLVTLKEELNVAMANNEISKAAVLRTELEVSASAVENALKEWHTIPPDDFIPCHCSKERGSGQSEDRNRLESILNNALAYRHSALIYLYRTIYQYPRTHPLVQHHSHISLTYCASVSNIGPKNALLWPLFVAACEAVSSADRELAQQAFISISRRQGMININHAWTIVQEVWRRVGKAEMLQQQDEITMMGFGNEELWRTVGADMGIVVVFG